MLQWVGNPGSVQLGGYDADGAGLTQVNTVTPVGSASRAWFVVGWNDRGKQGICF